MNAGTLKLGKWLLGGMVAALAAVPVAASAGEGAYVGLEGGANFVLNQNFRIYGTQSLVLNDDDILFSDKLKLGFIGGLVGGYAFDSGLRPELELDFRRNQLKSAVVTNSRSNDVGGFQNAETAIGNLWFDFFKEGAIHPYIGGGAGGARIDFRHPAYDGINRRSDNDLVFAYQGGAGIGIDLGPQLTLSADYRYLETVRGSFDLLGTTPETHVKSHYRAHTGMIGLKYYFAAPPHPPAVAPEPPAAVVPVETPPPPPPPPCQAAAPGQAMDLSGCKTGDTLVLRGVNFQFDKATLTLNAEKLLDELTAALTKRTDIKVELGGHTDSKGSDAYNQKLSDRRAATVRKYLVDHSIDAARLSTRGYGETMPIADNGTDEGRELNRRVELKVTYSEASAGNVEVAVPGPNAPGPSSDVTPASPAAPPP